MECIEEGIECIEDGGIGGIPPPPPGVGGSGRTGRPDEDATLDGGRGRGIAYPARTDRYKSSNSSLSWFVGASEGEDIEISGFQMGLKTVSIQNYVARSNIQTILATRGFGDGVVGVREEPAVL